MKCSQNLKTYVSHRSQWWIMTLTESTRPKMQNFILRPSLKMEQNNVTWWVMWMRNQSYDSYSKLSWFDDSVSLEQKGICTKKSAIHPLVSDRRISHIFLCAFTFNLFRAAVQQRPQDRLHFCPWFFPHNSFSSTLLHQPWGLSSSHGGGGVP